MRDRRGRADRDARHGEPRARKPRRHRGLLGELGPAVPDPQVVLLDGTGARAGVTKLGVGLHLAVGLLGRDGPLRRRRAETAWLAATVDQPWETMAEKLACLTAPAAVLLDGQDTLTALVERRWPATPIPAAGGTCRTGW